MSGTKAWAWPDAELPVRAREHAPQVRPLGHNPFASSRDQQRQAPQQGRRTVMRVVLPTASVQVKDRPASCTA